ncbi:MAG: NAD(P)-dependent oxidoreductase [Gemmataceae bacterium]
MRVAITGSSGFIGRHLHQTLERQGVECLLVPRRIDAAFVLQVSERWNGQSFTLFDLAWDTSRPVYYAAHTAQVHRLAEVVEALVPLGLARVVGTGTSEEYGPQHGFLCENDPPQFPLTPYGWGKRTAGDMLRAWSERAGIACVWVRPFIVYGPGQGGEMLIPYAVRQGLAGLPASFSSCVQQRDLVHVRDLVRLFELLLHAEWSGFEVVNAGSGQGVALCEVLHHIADRLSCHALFKLGARPARPGEPALHVANVERARLKFGWRTEIPWREGMDETIEAARRPSACAA